MRGVKPYKQTLRDEARAKIRVANAEKMSRVKWCDPCFVECEKKTFYVNPWVCCHCKGWHKDWPVQPPAERHESGDKAGFLIREIV